MNIDKNLVPVRLESTEYGVSLSSLGVTLRFNGSVLQIDNRRCGYSLQANDSGLLILTGELQSSICQTIKNVEWFHGEWSQYDEMLVSSTELQDNFLFFRAAGVSFFLSLDFPCSTISEGSVSYRPYRNASAASVYHTETLSIGAVRLSGNMVGRFDHSEIEGVSEYIETRFPTHFNRPVNSMVGITNRMTDVREGRIFYSMYNNPTLFLDPETVKKEIDLCAELGIEYYQLFEGKYDWPNETACEKNMKDIMAHAREKGVRVGDYVHPGDLYCPHYNYEHRTLDKPQWRRMSNDGSRSELCFGNDEYVDFIIDDLVSHNKKYGEEMICLDMLSVLPCSDEGHGHGEGGLYKQIKGLCRFTAALANISPDYLIWTNSGNWLQFMPKLLWFNPNVYLSDPHPREYNPTLNMLKLLDDARREQMVSVHDKFFVPYRYYTNCEYYLSRHSRVNDQSYFEYGMLQGLAVNPNICFGELRTYLDHVPHSEYEYSKRFIAKWIRFIKDHFDSWKSTIRIGDSPGVGANEIYAHIKDDQGFICFVNQDQFSKRSTIHLDQRIGLLSGDRFALKEIYPQECRCVEGKLPYSSFGDQVTFEIPPCSVRYIEIAPVGSEAFEFHVHGLPAAVEATDDGYRITLSAPQGEIRDIGLVFPQGQGLTGYSVESLKTVKMYTFPSKCELIECHGNVAALRVHFPREKVVRELSSWSVDGGPQRHLPSSSSRFLGGFVHNLFSEDHVVVLDVKTVGKLLSKEKESVDSGCSPSVRTTGDERGVHVYETSFHLPFIEWPNMSMAYGWDEVIELAFMDAGQVKSLSCRIDGEPVEVCRYRYPANPTVCSFYIELIHVAKSGTDVDVRLAVEWLD